MLCRCGGGTQLFLRSNRLSRGGPIAAAGYLVHIEATRDIPQHLVLVPCVHLGAVDSGLDARPFHSCCTRSRTLNSSFQRRPSRATHHNCSMPVSVTILSKLTGTTSAVSPASKLTSIGESSARASPKSSIRSEERR